MSLGRREFLLTLPAAAAVAADKKAAPTRPNILLVIADDLGAWMLGSYGNKEIQTPNLDRLARTGIRFVNSFAVSPVGPPSRLTLLTGLVPRQHGLQDFPSSAAVEGSGAASVKGQMLSDLLSQSGYNSGYIGKWDLPSEPIAGHGLGYSYTFANTESGYKDPQMTLNGAAVNEQGLAIDLLTRRAGEFLDKQTPAKPFFLTVGYDMPFDGHDPKFSEQYAQTKFETIGWLPAAANAKRAREVGADPVSYIRRAAAATSALDAQVAALLDKLRERKLLDSTMVIFTADNGSLLGRHGLWGDGLASDPANMYDEVVRVPLLISWPGKIPTDAIAPEIIGGYDMFPSLCEAASLELPRLRSGRSFLPLATRRALPKGRPWKNIAFAEMRDVAMARDARFKLVVRAKGGELYDLTKDAMETINFFDDPQYVTVRQRLQQELADWRGRTA